MCGIAGYTGPSSPGRLEGMAEKLVHRGPDQGGMYAHAEINLCMRRLAIVDLSTGEQPKFNSDGTVALVFNGEIYNYVELRQQLEAKGYVFQSQASDTEVIPHLYEEYGMDFVSHLVGMFAIALYDHRLHRLYLIRDRLGKKPLYYHWDQEGRQLAFASELNALGMRDGSQHVDAESAAWFFSQKAMPLDASIDARVKKLPPGSWLQYDPATNALEIRSYWRIDSRPRDARRSEAEWARALDERLAESVRLRMRADVEVGAFLSGGLDSSLVVAYASRLTRKPLKTYCLTYAEEINHKSSDRKFSEAVSKQCGTRHREVLLTPESFVEEIPKIVRQYGEPNSAVLSAWFIAREMRKDIKVALSGDGADELFGSYFTHRIAAALREQRLGPAEEAEAIRFLTPAERGFLDTLPRAGAGATALESMVALMDRFSVFPESELKRLLAPRLELAESVKKRIEGFFEGRSLEDPLQEALSFDSRNLLVNQVLNYSDLLAMAHSVEVRTPFLDHRLVELAFDMDSRMKIHQGQTKKVLKAVARKYLPEELVSRPKEGFVEPAVHWLGSDLKDFCLSHLLGESFNRFGLLDAEYARSVVARFYETRDFYLGKRVWSLLMFAIWEKQHDAQ